MKIKQQATPEYATDANGQQLVHVALANSNQRATLYAEDYARCLAAGFSPHWSFTNTGGPFWYVLVNARSPRNSQRSLTVARWIAGAGKGVRVGYADGDRLNLRTENLVKVQGPAKAAVQQLLVNDGTPLLRKSKPEHRSSPTQPAASVTVPTMPKESAKVYLRRVENTGTLRQHIRGQSQASNSNAGAK